MSKVADSIIKSIVSSVKDNGNVFPPVNDCDRLSLRNSFFSCFGSVDYTETASETGKKLLKLAILCYNKDNTGFEGIKKEIMERFKNRKRMFCGDFFKASDAKGFDFYIGRKQIEKKTGCGEWLRGHGSLDEIRKEYEKSGTYIKWDYVHKAGNEKEFDFDIHIFTTWKKFFAYLDTYSAGYQTFFKLNTVNSIKQGRNVYDLQTLKTSKKKVRFLKAFPND